MKNAFKVLAATCLLAIGSTANAATVDLGLVEDGTIVGGSLMSGTGVSIVDQWTFTLGADLLTAISLDSNDADPFFEISDFVASSSSAGIVFVYDAGDNSYAFSGPLAAGTYTIDVTGTVTGSFAGQYDVIIGASAVSIPAAVWLFGSALLGLMASGRRELTI